eukprot:SAG11_NODE_23776_length_383_cov_0.897887_1_plen_66_part_10
MTWWTSWGMGAHPDVHLQPIRLDSVRSGVRSSAHVTADVVDWQSHFPCCAAAVGARANFPRPAVAD